MPTFTAQGISMYFEIRGQGKTTVFIAGFLSGGNTWSPLVKHLESRFSCLTFDNRGVGKSSAPKGRYTISMLSEDLLRLLDYLDIGNAVVVGHSMGGFVALELALAHPERVSRLVLVSTAAAGNPAFTGMSLKAQSALFNSRGKREQILDEILAVSLGKAFRKQAPDKVEQLKRLLLEASPTAAGYFGQTAAVSLFDIREKLSGLACPTLITHGMEDNVFPPSNAAFLKDNLKRATLSTLPGVGHCPHIEYPEILAEIILTHTF
jgi:3-oxoadipate enol-lactonase